MKEYFNTEAEQTIYFNTEAEQTILGSIIVHNLNFARVGDFLEKKHFYEPANAEIWDKLEKAIQGGRSDKTLLKDFFNNNEAVKTVGGSSYLTTLLSRASGVIDIRDYAKEVVEAWQKRQLFFLCAKLILDLKNKSFGEILSDFENELIGLAVQEPRKKTQTTKEIIDEMDSEVLTDEFISTGFEKLDEYLNGGMYKQQLCFIGARPSVGKTSLAQNIILGASLAGKRCYFISLEVDKRNVIHKFLSILSEVGNWKIQKKQMSGLEYQDFLIAKQKLRDLAIPIDDSSYLSIAQIGRLIKNRLDREPIDLVVVDYIQIVRGDDVKGKNEALIIKENTTILKSFAKRFNIAVLCLAQINRKAVEGAKQEPTINDFKSSGGIEEDADVAIILHRDRNDEKKEGYFSSTGKLIIAKNRHGKTGEIAIKFDGETGKFGELEGL
jgi:replicative DNA helicase